MDDFQRQQFDVLLVGATEAFLERAVQRCAGQETAYARLRENPDADGIWLSQFVEAAFAEHCLDNADGAAFVLRALQRRRANISLDGAIADSLVAAAKQVFGELLRERALESLGRSMSYS